jgi:hypothetical protein
MSDAMPQTRSKSIVNIADIALLPRPPQYLPKGAAAERYDARSGLVSGQMGAQKLGFNITATDHGHFRLNRPKVTNVIVESLLARGRTVNRCPLNLTTR